MTWKHRSRSLAVATLAFGATGLLTPPVPPRSPQNAPPKIELPPGAPAADPVALARAVDDRAYADYLHEREVLIARGFLGQWLAIQDGQILPRGSNGEIAPAESIDVLCFLVDPGHEQAKHRYLFRIGEEGDTAYHFFAPNLPWSDALGTGLFRASYLGEPGSDIVFGPDRVYAKRGERRHSWEFGEKGIALELADPTGSTKVNAIVTPSSACDGTFVLSAETAKKLGLERFEIPGACLYGPEELDRYRCRRARLRWRVPELDLDVTLPVAIWPERH